MFTISRPFPQALKPQSKNYKTMSSFLTNMSLFNLFSLLILLSLFLSIAQADVPQNATFKFINEGEFGPYIVEYGGDYRTLSIFNSPFQLCFYNTTPNAFTLALRMATTRSESLFRWVWEANRNNPVGENATLTFGTDGNLVLADFDGRVAWQTNTSNKGVTGFKLLSNGNIVLHDSNNNFIWKSFDYPTDTLLVGQSLRSGTITKLVSRLSQKENKEGPYSFVLEPKGLSLYYKSNNSANPLLYFTSTQWLNIQDQGSLQNVTIKSEPETDEAYSYYVTVEFQVANSSIGGNVILARPKYNATLSFLRLGIDGNLKVYTYYDKVDSRAWEETFTLFDRDSIWETECQLPERCGNFGLCEDNQCVACPLSKGLVGWSKTCEPEKLNSCNASSLSYYKVEGVDHFLSKYNSGDDLNESDCGNKCTQDCKCLGYFYNQGTSRCLIAYELKTLIKVDNSTHVGYIKTPI